MSELFPFTEDDLSVFLAEGDELVTGLEAALLAIEASFRRGQAPDPELVAAAFRAAHTLKGSSAAVGMQAMSGLTHAMETVLDGIRRGGHATGGRLEVLLHSLDHIRRQLVRLAGALSEGGPEEFLRLGREPDLRAEELVHILASPENDVGRAVAERRRDAAAGRSTGSVGHEAAVRRGVGGGQGAGGGEATVRRGVGGAHGVGGGEAAVRRGVGGARGVGGGRVAPAQDERVLEVGVTFHEQCAMPAVRAYQVLMALEDAGEILGSDPSVRDIEDERVGRALEVIVETALPADQIRARLMAIGDVVEVIVQASEGAVDGQSGLAEGAPVPGRSDARCATEPGGGGVARGGGGVASGAVRGAAADGGSGPVAVGGDGAGTPEAGELVRSVRVDVRVLDELMNLAGELVIGRTRLERLLSDAQLQDEDLGRAVEDIGRVASELQEQVMKTRMVPLENLFRRFPRMIRDLAAAAGKEVNLVVRGERTELDRALMGEIGDPLVHILRNAVDHGLESPREREAAGKPRAGTIVLQAQHEENHVLISVGDDGRGIDVDRVRAKAVSGGLVSAEEARELDEAQVLNLIFAPGFSTAQRVTEVSGRGVGLDVVRRNVHRVGGTLEVESRPGQGVEFRMRLPLTLAIIRCLLCQWGDEIYALPLGQVDEVAEIDPETLPTVYQKKVLLVRGNAVPFVSLGEALLGSESAGVEFAVVVRSGGRQAALGVTSLLGDQEVVVRDLGAWLGNVRGMAGATILGDGRVALILDMGSVLRGRLCASAA